MLELTNEELDFLNMIEITTRKTKPIRIIVNAKNENNRDIICMCEKGKNIIQKFRYKSGDKVPRCKFCEQPTEAGKWTL